MASWLVSTFSKVVFFSSLTLEASIIFNWAQSIRLLQQFIFLQPMQAPLLLFAYSAQSILLIQLFIFLQVLFQFLFFLLYSMRYQPVDLHFYWHLRSVYFSFVS